MIPALPVSAAAWFEAQPLPLRIALCARHGLSSLMYEAHPPLTRWLNVRSARPARGVR